MKKDFNKLKFNYCFPKEGDDGGVDFILSFPNNNSFLKVEKEDLKNIKEAIENFQDDESERSANILFIRTGHLVPPEFISSILEKLDYKLSKNNEASYDPVPLITICISPPGIDSNDLTNRDPRFRFLDSSIWFRCIFIDDSNKNTFKSRLEHVVNDITWAYEKGLYYSNVALEYLEFNTRLFEVSRLEEIGGYTNGHSHASKVTPFIFHSETAMRERANELRQKLDKQTEKTAGLHWGFLLIDDFADTPLKSNDKENAAKMANKGNIIRELINAGENLASIPVSPFCQPSNFFKRTSVREGLKMLKQPNNRADIILLDFLFSRASGEEKEQKAKYGDELLVGLIDEKEKDNFIKGPFGKFWIFPVSVFSDALLSSLQEKNIQHIEQDWLLSRGADPINSPHLFRASLYEFMHLQLKRVDYRESGLFKFLADNPLTEDSIERIKGERYGREWARTIFPRFNQKFSDLESIQKHNSPFGDSVTAYLHTENAKKPINEDEDSKTDTSKKSTNGIGMNNVNDLMQNFRQLIFLMAYSTGFDAPLMRREFAKIKARYNRLRPVILEEVGEDTCEKIGENLNQLGIAVLTTHEVYQ